MKRYIVLILALGQIVTSAFGGFQGKEGGAFNSAIVTPAGYAFSIWGIITLGCIAYAIYQLLPGQRKNKLYDELVTPSSIVFLGFSIWILAASRDMVWTTVIIFTIMLVSLWKAIGIIKKFKKMSATEGMLIKGTFGLYLGWSTAALPQNVSAALVYNNIWYPDMRSFVGFSGILIATLVFALWTQKKIGPNYYFTVAVIWALVAIAVRTSQTSVFLMIISVFAAITLILYAVLIQKKKV